jgi:hypothetical protein
MKTDENPCFVAILGRKWKRLNEIEASSIGPSPETTAVEGDRRRFGAMQAIRNAASYHTPACDEGWAFHIFSAELYTSTSERN